MKILIAKEKHCDDYFVCETDEDVNKALIELFEERKAQGYYYTDEELARTKSNQGIIRLMYAHQDHEYEGFYIESARVPK
jgi:hypothetical protein